MKSKKIDYGIDDVNLMPIRSTLYNRLKKINPNHKMMAGYEEVMEDRCITLNSNAKKKVLEIKEEEFLPIAPIKYESLLKLFKGKYRQNEDVLFDECANNGEAGIFVATLISYFTGKKSFFRSPLLYRENEKTVVSHEKGLLVLGGYGNGKTSVFKTFHDMFHECFTEPIGVRDMNENIQPLKCYGMHFGFTSTSKVNRDFEVLSTPVEKEFYWNKQLKYTKYFDDLLAEDKAKYGHNDLMRSILEERYILKAKTHASINYVDNGEDKIVNTLNAIGDRYGDRIYDRIFQMFNIIALEGGSLRR